MSTQQTSERHNDTLTFELHHRLARTIEAGRTSVDDMAAIFECHRNTVLNYVAGRTAPRKRDVREWALRTGVSFDWLWEGIDPADSAPTPPAGETGFTQRESSAVITYPTLRIAA